MQFFKLKDKIPSIYHSLTPDINFIDYPDEKISTCSKCKLCLSTESPYVNIKCCTYHPRLPNFSIGGILFDEEENGYIGQGIVNNIISSKIGLTPYGVFPSKKYLKLESDIGKIDFWSRPREHAQELACPFFVKGICSIWRFRDNLCATHFCSSVGGKAGKNFWKALRNYLRMTEAELVQYALFKLKYPFSNINTDLLKYLKFEIEDDDGNLLLNNYKELWGTWYGKEVEFYSKCYEVISNINYKTFRRITGTKRQILKSAILETQKEFLNNIIPEFLTLNSEVNIETTDKGNALLTYNNLKTEIPASLLPLVKGFNGKRSTLEMFELGYKILYNLSDLVDELLAKGILIEV